MKAPASRPARRLVAALTALTVGAALAACGGATNASPDESGDGTIPETIRIATDSGPTTLDTNVWAPFAGPITYLYGGILV
ncbi:MAG: hypothetical protein LBD90_00655, partial [Bifidobacteriaceae bacterium]|nr:hypothetical protein [Bifidobacteriaceae bacterium]